MSAFRAVWPIVDESVPFAEMCKQARADLPMLAAQAKARLSGRGRFIIAPSDMIAGSGRVTELVLVYDGTAHPIERRLPVVAEVAPEWINPDRLDEVVVDRLVALRRVPASRAEKVEAMHRWLLMGRSEKSLCEAHGWRTSRYVGEVAV